MIQNGTKFEWIIFHEFVKWLRHDTMIERVLNTFDRCLKYHSLGLCDVQWARATALWLFFVLFPSEPFPIHKFHICTVPKQVLLSISVYPSVFLKKKTRQLCICTSHCTTPYEPEWLICSGFTVGWICKIVSSISSNRESPDGLGEGREGVPLRAFSEFLRTHPRSPLDRQIQKGMKLFANLFETTLRWMWVS